MAQGRFVNEYRKASVNGASPLKLVVMLYDGALKFMEAGKAAMETNKLEGQNSELKKAQKVLTELMSCLDMEQGGEIAQNLLALYTYVYNELVKANIDDDVAALNRCIAVLSELRASWVEVEQSISSIKAKDAA